MVTLYLTRGKDVRVRCADLFDSVFVTVRVVCLGQTERKGRQIKKLEERIKELEEKE